MPIIYATVWIINDNFSGRNTHFFLQKLQRTPWNLSQCPWLSPTCGAATLTPSDRSLCSVLYSPHTPVLHTLWGFTMHFSHLVQYTNTQEHLIALSSHKYIGAYGSYFNHNTSTSADKIWEILEYYILVQTLATTIISRIWRRVC